MATPPSQPGPEPDAPQDTPTEGAGHELFLFGNEEILRGSDNGTLVAFAAIAFQELRGGEGEAAHRVGCIFLLFSVLFCALVHFALGNAYIHRARSLTRRLTRPTPRRRQAVTRAFDLALVWISVLTQFAFLALGLLLILPEQPPGLLERYLMPLFE